MVTSLILVVKIEHFSLQNCDENEARRQNRVFSSKTVTSLILVVKIEHFSLQNCDENEARRHQK
ncbi:hypothetical protein [Caldifermentibacillus hisashii]|uniref:hypothetical protein n=1 Tax=Caldifermentibacillus hisashii TaxID=996558 RepID=UPI00343BDB26